MTERMEVAKDNPLIEAVGHVTVHTYKEIVNNLGKLMQMNLIRNRNLLKMDIIGHKIHAFPLLFISRY